MKRSRFLIIFISLLAICSLFAGVVYVKQGWSFGRPGEPRHPGESYKLTQVEVVALTKQAESGDKRAAKKLVDYYRFYKKLPLEAEKFKALGNGAGHGS
jgi:hypothetical protein